MEPTMKVASAMMLCAVLISCVTQEPPPAPRRRASSNAPWGNTLVAAHDKADAAIDAGDLRSAREALLAGTSTHSTMMARQDLLQRLAWVEIRLGLTAEAIKHADEAIALDDDDERSYANALLVRHMIATQAKDQAKIDSLIEDLLIALDPN
jgi:hypothetical protein